MLTEDDRERRAAVHEAGHAVVALLVGWELTHVSVDGGRAGMCLTRSPKWADPFDRAVVDLAGIAAQEAFGFAQDGGCRTDSERVAEHARETHPASAALREAFRVEARAEADNLVRRGRRAIEALAELLLDVEEIGEHPARALILETLHEARA